MNKTAYKLIHSWTKQHHPTQKPLQKSDHERTQNFSGTSKFFFWQMSFLPISFQSCVIFTKFPKNHREHVLASQNDTQRSLITFQDLLSPKWHTEVTVHFPRLLKLCCCFENFSSEANRQPVVTIHISWTFWIEKHSRLWLQKGLRASHILVQG